MRRCRISVAAISGNVTITVAAIQVPQGIWKALVLPTNDTIATGTV